MSRSLNAKEVSAILGISLVSVYARKLELGRHTKSGWVFSRDKVEAARLHRLSRSNTDKPMRMTRLGIEGQVAASVFQKFAEGQKAIDIVIALAVAPEVVRQLESDYAAMRGGIVISSDDLKELYKLPLSGTIPCRTSSDLLELLRASLHPPDMCSACQRRPSIPLCETCALRDVRSSPKAKREKQSA